jgi:hypothetical protein
MWTLNDLKAASAKTYKFFTLGCKTYKSSSTNITDIRFLFSVVLYAY